MISTKTAAYENKGVGKAVSRLQISSRTDTKMKVYPGMSMKTKDRFSSLSHPTQNVDEK